MCVGDEKMRKGLEVEGQQETRGDRGLERNAGVDGAEGLRREGKRAWGG